MERKGVLMEYRIGKIVAVCTRVRGGVPKSPRPWAVICHYGFDGDYHAKPTRRSFKFPYLPKQNTDRHLTIVGKEVLDALNTELGINLGPGDLGENILVEGLGDLSEVAPGDMVCLSTKAILRVSEQNVPCANLQHYHPLLIRKIMGRRGILCSVVAGIGEVILPNDLVWVKKPL